MSVFSNSSFQNHEQINFFRDPETGLKAIIAVHNTNLGPALGGCRMWDYKDEDEAITDVLRLSRGMTYKSALAGLALGGGKSVILGDSRKDKTPEAMQAMGRFVETLKGLYITAEDVGTSVEDMHQVNKFTDHVVGLPPQDGSEAASGDPSPITALGTFVGVKAAAKHQLGSDDLTGKTVSVQGLGHVGLYLCEHLHNAGAELIVTDINQQAIDEVVNRFGAEAVAPEAIYTADADIFAPCALGGIINDETLSVLKAKVVAGASNNQLLEEKHGELLQEKGILYAPDYVINAGGVINVYYERKNRVEEGVHYTRQDVEKHLDIIGENLQKIFEIADENQISTSEAADRLGEKIFMNPEKPWNKSQCKQNGHCRAA